MSWDRLGGVQAESSNVAMQDLPQNLFRMYGDLQGIAGKSLQEIEGLELRTLEDSKTL